MNHVNHNDKQKFYWCLIYWTHCIPPSAFVSYSSPTTPRTPSQGDVDEWRRVAGQKSHLCWNGKRYPAKLLINDNFIANSEEHNRMNLSLKWIRLLSFFPSFSSCRIFPLAASTFRQSLDSFPKSPPKQTAFCCLLILVRNCRLRTLICLSVWLILICSV